MRSCLDAPDMRISYAIPFGEVFSSFITSADGSNISVRKARVPMCKPIVMPSFFSRVSVIFGFGSNSQMSGVDTRWVVASVHDDHSFWDKPNMVLIRVSVGAHRLFAGKQKDSVTVPITGAFPFPTTVCFFKPMFEYIRRAKQCIIVKTVGFALSVVASSAQLSRNGFRIFTLNATESNSGLVSHMTPPISRFYAITEV
jgi:hypothetical protein